MALHPAQQPGGTMMRLWVQRNTVGPLAFLAALALTSCFTGAATSASSAVQSLTGATANFAPNDPPGEWRSQARDFANTRYSALDQITTENVGKLRVAWTFSD